MEERTRWYGRNDREHNGCRGAPVRITEEVKTVWRQGETPLSHRPEKNVCRRTALGNVVAAAKASSPGASLLGCFWVALSSVVFKEALRQFAHHLRLLGQNYTVQIPPRTTKIGNLLTISHVKALFSLTKKDFNLSSGLMPPRLPNELTDDRPVLAVRIRIRCMNLSRTLTLSRAGNSKCQQYRNAAPVFAILQINTGDGDFGMRIIPLHLIGGGGSIRA